MPVATPTALDLAKRKAKALDALDLMGSIVGRRIYDPARETLVLRVGFWLSQGWATADDVCEACESLTTPAALSKIRGEWDMNADLAAAVEKIQERKANALAKKEAEARRQADREADDRWANESDGNRAVVLKLLESVGTQIGKGRPTQPEVARGDEDQTPGQEAEQA